jgi:hypothetical protein
MAVAIKSVEMKRRRRWYRLHWLTWLPVIVVGAAIARCQFIERFHRIAGNSFSYLKSSCFGWPVAHVESLESSKSAGIAGVAQSPKFEYTWFFPSLAVNCVFWLLLVSAAGLAVEGWLRKPKRWQFTLRGLGLLFAATGAVLTAVKHRLLIAQGLSRLGMWSGLN